MNLPIRPRRNRISPAIRALTRETDLTADRFIYPLFIHAGKKDIPIQAMPGQSRLSLDGLRKEAKRAWKLGIQALVLFPAIDNSLKTHLAQESYNDNGLVPQAIKLLKKDLPDLAIFTDVALDPYSSDGHDGIVDDSPSSNGYVLNDQTIEILCKQALTHARAGATFVSPSDMMDGRVAAIRAALDSENFQNVGILSYTAKYASAFYGPFRNALDSAPRFGDKKTYQMDYSNAREALRETALDQAEGADMVMVKPAGAYLDIIYRVRQATTLPVAAYQVSGEYLMIKAAAQSGWVDEKKLVLETLTSIRRAGADMILTYFAPQAAEYLK
jgi:porphobilinogen synthase